MRTYQIFGLEVAHHFQSVTPLLRVTVFCTAQRIEVNCPGPVKIGQANFFFRDPDRDTVIIRFVFCKKLKLKPPYIEYLTIFDRVCHRQESRFLELQSVGECGIFSL